MFLGMTCREERGVKTKNGMGCAEGVGKGGPRVQRRGGMKRLVCWLGSN